MKIPKPIGALFLIAILLILGLVIPISLVLSNSEISNPEIAFSLNLFSSLLLVGLVGAGAVYFARFLWKGDNKYGNSFGFFDIGEKVPFFKRFTAIQLTLYAIIFFSIIFLVANQLNLGGFTGLKVLPQQFTPFQSLVFSTLLIPTGEEAMSILVVGILVLGLVLLALKYKVFGDNFKIFYFGVIPILIGFLAMIWHGSAYTGSDVSLVIVFFFWLIKTLFILVTGFVLIGVIMHMGNNFFIDFARLYSNSVLTGVAIGLIAVLILIVLFIYKGKIFGSRQNVQESKV